MNVHPGSCTTVLLVLALLAAVFVPCLAAGTSGTGNYPSAYPSLQKTSGLIKPTPYQLYITKPKGIIPYQQKAFPTGVVRAIEYSTSPAGEAVISRYLGDPGYRESVSASEKARIEEVIRNLDYAESKSGWNNQGALYKAVTAEVATAIRDNVPFSEPGYCVASYDFSVVYHEASPSLRDSDGYVNVLVIPRNRGDQALFIDETAREFLIPKGASFGLTKEVPAESVVLRMGFKPLYPEKSITKVRLLYLKETR